MKPVSRTASDHRGGSASRPTLETRPAYSRAGGRGY